MKDEEIERHREPHWPDGEYIYRVANSKIWRWAHSVYGELKWTSCKTPDLLKAVRKVNEWRGYDE